MTAVGRPLPHDLDAEAAVLSACLLPEEARFDDVAHLIPDAAAFQSVANRRIWEAISALATAGERVDMVLVGSWLKSRERLAEVGGTAYLAKVCDAAPSVANLEAYARRVTELWQRRVMIQTAQKIAAEGYGDVGETAGWLEQCEVSVLSVGESALGAEDGPQSIRDVVRSAVEQLKATKGIGVTTGLTELDDLLSGLHEGDLTIIAARPGVGKTSLAMCLALAVADRPALGSAVFSLEMPREQIVARAMCAESMVSLKAWRGRTLTPHDWDRLTAAAEWMSGIDLEIDAPVTLTVPKLRSAVRRIVRKLARVGKKLGLVVIDYLQLMTGRRDKNGSREEEISGISRGLKQLAKEFSVPVVALSQLNRDIEKRGNGRPQLSDLRESGAIEQDADNIIFVHRVGDDESEISQFAELIVGKQRNGPTGSVWARWVSTCAKFRDLDPGEASKLEGLKASMANTKGGNKR